MEVEDLLRDTRKLEMAGRAKGTTLRVKELIAEVNRNISLCHLDRSGPGFPTSLLLRTATYATLREERRLPRTDRTVLDRKSGVAEWRDLQFCRG